MSTFTGHNAVLGSAIKNSFPVELRTSPLSVFCRCWG